jgi:hypothetical protein
MSRTTHRKRYARTDVLTTAYMRLRKEGVPSFVTSHEAYRMTDGRIGTKGLHSLDHGIGLMALVKKADGDLHAPKEDPETCVHEERLPIPGLTSIAACMDCGVTFTAEPIQPEDDGTEAEALAPVQDPRTMLRKGAVVKYLSAVKKAGSAQWRVRYIDPSDGTLTLDLLGHSKRSTARFEVDPARVVVVQGAPETY